MANMVNLVFQGGGVRGMAYAGVLAEMPTSIAIRSVAGTSAGAIVAALLAIGKSAAEITAILRTDQVRQLLHKEEVESVQQLRAFISTLDPLAKQIIQSRKIPFWRLWKLRDPLRELADQLQGYWQERGIYRSDRLGDWLSRILEGKTFAEAKAVEDVQIVSADVSRQAFYVYRKKTHAGLPLAQAVYASASIPIFFRPFSTGNDILVDGGILSNYPASLFADSKYPTIGFRLRDLIPPPAIGMSSSTLSYLQALVQTMAEAHDKRQILPSHSFTYMIMTPPHIPFTKFDLTDTDLEELLYAGRQVGKQVKWEEHAQRVRQITFVEPKPEDVLELSAAQARQLYDSYADSQSWVEQLNYEVEFLVRIGRDWSVTYERTSKMAVKGKKSLVVSRFRMAGLPRDESGPVSLIDYPYTAVEITPDGAKDLIRIPAYNTNDHKGFVLFYTPPVSEDGGPRTFHTSFEVKQEFLMVPEGEPGLISYGVQRLAREHVCDLKFRILVDTELPKLILSPDFGMKPTVAADAKEIAGRYYREYLWALEPNTVSGEAVYSITVRLDKTGGPKK
jgi:predicted acylesterase/phospholipase RssA